MQADSVRDLHLKQDLDRWSTEFGVQVHYSLRSPLKDFKGSRGRFDQ